jgi:cytochrome b subunit of formate dehydrogenase
MRYLLWLLVFHIVNASVCAIGIMVFIMVAFVAVYSLWLVVTRQIVPDSWHKYKRLF